MSPDEERWAEVLAIERIHGERAAVWVAEQIAIQALAGDHAGVQRFREIAARLNRLLTGSDQ